MSAGSSSPRRCTQPSQQADASATAAPSNLLHSSTAAAAALATQRRTVTCSSSSSKKPCCWMSSQGLHKQSSQATPGRQVVVHQRTMMNPLRPPTAMQAHVAAASAAALRVATQSCLGLPSGVTVLLWVTVLGLWHKALVGLLVGATGLLQLLLMVMQGLWVPMMAPQDWPHRVLCQQKQQSRARLLLMQQMTAQRASLSSSRWMCQVRGVVGQCGVCLTMRRSCASCLSNCRCVLCVFWGGG